MAVATVATQTESQLILVMSDYQFRYCLYRVVAPKNNEDESIVGGLGEPLLKMDKSVFPDDLSFVAVGSKIFMFGGSFYPEIGESKMFIYDTLSDSLAPGPSLVSPKIDPFVFTLGAKVFALSCFIDIDHKEYPMDSLSNFGGYSYPRDPKPQFEVLDTENLEFGWSALPVPILCVTKGKRTKTSAVDACTVSYSGVGTNATIFISLVDFGTYAFVVEKKTWFHVTDEMLPFRGQANVIPPAPNLPDAPSLSCAPSRKSKGNSVYRFHYHPKEGDENNEFHFNEIEIEEDVDLIVATSLPPHNMCEPNSSITFDSHGRLYYVTSGSDEFDEYSSLRDRYVKVSVLGLSKVKCNQVQKKTIMHSNGRRAQKMTQIWRKKERVHDDEAIKLKMTQIWRKSFSAGSMYVAQQVIAALTM